MKYKKAYTLNPVFLNICRGWNSILGVELYDTSGPDGDSGLRIKEVLMSRDILSLTTSPLKQEELLGIKKKPKGLTQICLPG